MLLLYHITLNTECMLKDMLFCKNIGADLGPGGSLLSIVGLILPELRTMGKRPLDDVRLSQPWQMVMLLR